MNKLLKHFNNEAVIWDTEITSWKGSLERGWSGPNEYKELIQVGAARVTVDSLDLLEARDWIIKPSKNPKLSNYITKLTGISQERVDREGITFAEFLNEFTEWIGKRPMYSNGGDEKELKINCELNTLAYPLQDEQCFDIYNVFAQYGLNIPTSGRAMEAFDKEVTRRPHDALNDSLNLLDGLRELSRIVTK